LTATGYPPGFDIDLIHEPVTEVVVTEKLPRGVGVKVAEPKA